MISPSAEKSISITVKLHAILSNILGKQARTPFTLSLQAGAIVSDVPQTLGLPKMEMVYSLNGVLTDARTKLKDGDQLDIIPAISGGLGSPEAPP